ncbi:hypothetical protein [Candidatus Magnetominusculus dajiuhuensis]|uniref:hypothetical protein n=1 Tax=Candidatus Magnetominusculus dajiuhuensis TaxID=3137712 RepID=UPI003B42FF34
MFENIFKSSNGNPEEVKKINEEIKKKSKEKNKLGEVEDRKGKEETLLKDGMESFNRIIANKTNKNHSEQMLENSSDLENIAAIWDSQFDYRDLQNIILTAIPEVATYILRKKITTAGMDKQDTEKWLGNLNKIIDYKQSKEHLGEIWESSPELKNIAGNWDNDSFLITEKMRRIVLAAIPEIAPYVLENKMNERNGNRLFS